MSEYLVRFKIYRTDTIFPKGYESSEVYEADTAKGALEKARVEFKKLKVKASATHHGDVALSILDIKKV